MSRPKSKPTTQTDVTPTIARGVFVSQDDCIVLAELARIAQMTIISAVRRLERINPRALVLEQLRQQAERAADLREMLDRA